MPVDATQLKESILDYLDADAMNSDQEAVSVTNGVSGVSDPTDPQDPDDQEAFSDALWLAITEAKNTHFATNEDMWLAICQGIADHLNESGLGGGGFSYKTPCVLASTANLDLTGHETIDGFLTTTDMRVLVKDQTNKAQNGIYLAKSTAWVRATDADAWDELVSAFVFITTGFQNGSCGYVSLSQAGGTLGSTDIEWAQISAAGQITAGAGLDKTGSTLFVGEGNGIDVGTDTISVDPDGPTIEVSANGVCSRGMREITETNPTDLTAGSIKDGEYLKRSGTNIVSVPLTPLQKATLTITGNGNDAIFTADHALGLEVVVTTWDWDTGYQVLIETKNTDLGEGNTPRYRMTFYFAAVPALNKVYKAVLVG